MASRILRCVMSGALLFATLHAAAQAPATTTPESDAAKAVRYTRALEAEPERPDALELRQWLTMWTLETPDYLVNVCDVLGLQDDGATPHAGELFMQLMYGNVAWQIEHGTQHDELSKQVAAAESALRAYTALVARDGRSAVPRLDALIAHGKAGTLRTHLAPIVRTKCPGGTDVAGEEDASPPPFLGGFLRESHVVYPLKVDGWEMQGEHRYDDQAAGASVRFLRAGGKSGWIDVFFYPVGVLSDGKAAELAAVERRSLLESWGKSMASEDDMTALSTFEVPMPPVAGAVPGREPESRDVLAHALDFAYSHEDKRLSSAMVFAVDRMYAIKFRYSAEAATASRDALRQELERFARAMLPQLEITSTGTCWTPPTVSTVGKEASAPEGVLARSEVDGEVVAWVLRDRVVVRDLSRLDPGLMRVAMSLQGRLYDGCTGPDPVQPAVPEGMRELRFEYRAGESVPSSRPLPVKRSGMG